MLGGATSSLLASSSDVTGNRWVLVTVALGLVGGVLLLVRGQRLPRTAFHVVTVLAAVLIGSGVVLAPDHTTAAVISVIFSILAIVLFAYFARRDATVQLVVLLAVATTALLVRGLPLGLTASLVCSLTVTSVGVRGLAVRAARAGRDPLTDLLTRRGFEQVLEEVSREAERSGATMSLALLDLDRFTEVNERLGQARGDALLQSVATDLHANLPVGTVLGRLGGDEFAVALTAEGRGALDVVERARGAVPHPLSAGVAERLPAEPLGEWLRRAEAALAEAKQLGRDRSVLADAASAHLVHGLAAVLADPATPGLRVELQPVVDPRSGAVLGVEALARWDHPARGPVPPQQFVEVAERAGLISALGAAVVRRACRAATDLRRKTHPDLFLTVNASGHELVEDDYADRVLAVLEETGLPPEALVVEVTESVVEGSSAAALLTVGRLRERGVRIAIDDFGAGYSTYSRLDTLPADILELDGALLDGATTSSRRRALLESAVSIGTALDLAVLVEGVETEEQAELLRELGCPLAQGYYYSRPRRPEQLLVQWDESGERTPAV